jgi:RNA-directed DNA polymerase
MPVEEQQKTLNAKLRGHYQHYGRPTNYQSLWRFFREVRHIWQKGLSRRTRGNGMTWEKYAAILRKHPLLLPHIQHSLEWSGESRLRNPLRKICTVGSARGESR